MALTASVARGRGAWYRILAVAGAIVILVSLLGMSAGRPATVLAAATDLVKFQFGPIATQTAGGAFQVSITALDRRDRPVKDHTGGTLTGLAASPDGTPATVGSLSWVDGVTNVSLTPVKSQTNVKLTLTFGAVASDSTAFNVQPAAAEALAFADAANDFNGQPVDAKFDTPLKSSLAASPPPVKVIALDTYGNRVGGVPVNVAAIPDDTAVTSDAAAATTSSTVPFGAATYGEASFTNLVIRTLGTYTLAATATGLTGDTSDAFEIVADLAKCDGADCKNTGKSVGANQQITHSSIKTTGDFDNEVVLTTTFLGDESEGQCLGSGTGFGQLTEVRVQGDGVGDTRPAFVIAMIIPKATLQALDLTSRAVDTYDVCLGAVRLEEGGGWTGKVTEDDPTTDTDLLGGAYWGWVADCGMVAAGNPCVSLKTKNAGQLQAALGLNKSEFKELGFQSSDLAIVIQKPWPWDGKMGLK